MASVTLNYPHKMYINFGDSHPPITPGLRLVKIKSVGPKFASVMYKDLGYHWFPKKFTREEWDELCPMPTNFKREEEHEIIN